MNYNKTFTNKRATTEILTGKNQLQYINRKITLKKSQTTKVRFHNSIAYSYLIHLLLFLTSVTLKHTIPNYSELSTTTSYRDRKF